MILLLFVFGATTGSAQHTVTFQITGYPAYHAPADPVFLAGSFNNWNPGHESFRLNENKLTIRLPAGKHEFKFTKGSWSTVESAAAGAAVPNRQVVLESDTTILIHIEHWSDRFPAAAPVHTAGPQVQVLDSSFYMPQLGRSRRVWVYLPEDYHRTRKKYPVLYMHDGQNVFDAATSFSGEWGVDEALDSLSAVWGPAIVVAIDHAGQKRLNEYAPFDGDRFGKGEGDAYLSFLVHTLKPFVEKKYRVKKCRKYRAIAGSSMGGLISFYALLRYPKVFGAAGVFSPAFWINPQIKEQIPAKADKVKSRIFFYAGKEEGPEMVPDLLAVLQLMSRHSKARMTSVIRTDGTHSEAAWRKEFPAFYVWWKKIQN